MKRTFITLYILLTMVLGVAAQARLTTNAERVSFGQIEWKLPVTAEYTITNTGNKPLVLTEVEPDCACSAANWTQTPIAPGEKGKISVTFDAKALGHFHKSVAVFTNAQPHLVYLTFDGEVVRQVKDYSRTHPYLIGDIRISHNELEFADTHRGEHPVLQISVANTGNSPYTPVLMHLPSYLKAVASPTVLQEGERGVMLLELDTEKLSDYGLTQTSVYLSRFTGDKVSTENEIPFSVVLLPDFSDLSATQRANAPIVTLSATDINASALLAKKSKVRQDITITNTGRSPLHISKLQVNHPAVGAGLKKSTLQPGESTRLRITINKKHIKGSKRPLRLLMITNDPAQPKAVINVKHTH